MTRTGIDWEIFVRQGILYLPILVAWSVGIGFCLIRRRENPKGAMYLSLGILLQFSGLVLRIAIPYLDSHFFSPGGSLFSYIDPMYFHLTISVLTFLPSWLFISMAVFARPKHYDFRNEPAFDDEFAR